MAKSPTRIYRVILEHYRGAHPQDIADVLATDAFDFFDEQEAFAKAQAELASHPAPVLMADGVELWQASVEAGYYTGEGGKPLPQMSLERYSELADQGTAHWEWDNSWDSELFEQPLPADVAETLAQCERG